MITTLPESPRDTLMACFALFLTGKETRKERNLIRQRLMDHFQHIMRRDTEFFTHPAIRAFVNRLHAIHPLEVPVSAEVFYIQNETRLEREAITFLNQNRQEGFVGDKFTMCYLFAELFQVDVHLYQPEEVVLSVVPFVKYHIHIQHEHHRFNLLLPRVPAKRSAYITPSGPRLGPFRTQFPLYCLNGEISFVPPAIEGYQVHSLIVYKGNSQNIYSVDLVNGKTWTDILFDKSSFGYVWLKTEPDTLEILSCISTKQRIAPRFYLNNFPCTLYFVVESSIEDAQKAIQIEC